MNKVKLFGIWILAVVFTACGNATTIGTGAGSTGKATEIVRNVLDDDADENISGTYMGILPCADGEGMKTTIVLKEDKSYEVMEEYVGKNVVNRSAGKPWSLNEGLLTLENSKQVKFKYKVEKNSIRQLDIDSKVIIGTLADKYILKKQ
ncbi:MAG: copper resistance protein NlpE [Bacteroidota bacterium]